MFIRKIKQKNKNGTVREYLAIVESVYNAGKKKQRIIGYLGRTEEISNNGTIDKLLVQLSKYSQKLDVIDASKDISKDNDFYIGAKLCIEGLWNEIGLKHILNKLFGNTKHEFDIHKAIFDMVLSRLINPLSKLGIYMWQSNINDTDTEDTKLHNYYRALDVIYPYIETIEDELFIRRPFDLFNQKLDVVFYDTTSVKYYGDEQAGFLQHGYSKEKRGDLVQLVVGLLVDSSGIPVAHKIFSGNTSDVTTLQPLMKEFSSRFEIRNFIVVCDGGMISQENINYLEIELGLKYIIGTRMKKEKDVKYSVLCRGGRYRQVCENLKVKEVIVKDKRYILCYNDEESKRDKHKREKILNSLKDLEGQSINQLVGNRGFKSYLAEKENVIKLDKKKIDLEARYDGKWVLRTNTEMPSEEVALYYKTLLNVEQNFHNLKGDLRIAPMYHWNEKRIRAHVFTCYLSLVIWRTFIEKLRAVDGGVKISEVWHSICKIRCTELNIKDKKYLIRNETNDLGVLGFRVCKAKLPNLVVEKK